MSVRRPNILLIVADCARADRWLGPGRTCLTPNLDRLAADGVAFPVTIVEKAATTPSFATLLSGLYSPRHGVHLVWGYRLPAQVPLLTHVLAARGYHTYAEVTGPLLPEMGLDRGFDAYTYRAPCDQLHTAWGGEFLRRLRTGHYRAPWFILLHLWELHPRRRVAPECDAPRCGAREYDRAVSSLDVQLGRLFAALDGQTLTVFTGDHGEKLASESYRPGTAVDYARRRLGLEGAGGPLPLDVARWAGPSVLQALYGQCTPLLPRVRLAELRQSLAPGLATRLRDRLRLLRLTPLLFLHDLLSLGRPLKLTAMLQKRGLLDPQRAARKVARLTASLGRQRLLALHLRMWINSYRRNIDEGHLLHVYDFLVRVPLVLHWPERLPRGAVCTRMVRQPDILPTILDLLGAGPDELGAIDGRSFRPLLEDGAAAGAAALTPARHQPQRRPWQPAPAFLSVSGTPADLELRGVRTETHKYTFGPHNAELPQELYDLRADPGETCNLAAQQPELCAELRALADRFVPSAGAPPAAAPALSAEQQRRVEQHLRELGYLD